MEANSHFIVVIAEGAGQSLSEKDYSNEDVGEFVKARIHRALQESGLFGVKLEYFDVVN